MKNILKKILNKKKKFKIEEDYEKAAKLRDEISKR